MPHDEYAIKEDTTTDLYPNNGIKIILQITAIRPPKSVIFQMAFVFSLKMKSELTAKYIGR